MEFDFRLNSESIPYNPNPFFLGITFDERLCKSSCSGFESFEYYKNILA